MPNLSDLNQETYLGEDLYASFGAWGIRLRSEPNDNFVYLPLGSVLPAFLAYVDDLKVKLSQHLKDEAVSEEK